MLQGVMELLKVELASELVHLGSLIGCHPLLLPVSSSVDF